MQALLRYPGAKWSIAKRIISYFPKHKGYLEPYFGSGAILFHKQKCNLETVNDVDQEVINFFKVIRDEYLRLNNLLRETPYAKDVYNWVQNMIPKNDIERAYKFFLMSWMSHGGYQPNLTSWSHSKCPDGPNKAYLFKQAIDNMLLFTERLRGVQIENSDAIELIKLHDFDNTLIYLDPPYLQNTRKKGLYKFEMTDEVHKKLLFTILNLKNAKVLISGYDSELYNQLLSNWKKDYIKSLDGCGQVKNEVVWYNYTLQESLF